MKILRHKILRVGNRESEGNGVKRSDEITDSAVSALSAEKSALANRILGNLGQHPVFI